MSFNSDVLVWWVDQIVVSIGLIASIIMCIIVIKELKSMHHELAPTLLFFMYAVHIMSVLFFISCMLTLTILPLFRFFQIRADPETTCQVTYIGISALGAGLLLVVINLFFERLRLSFQDTSLSVSSMCNFLFRIILTSIWIFIGSIYFYASDPTPYNIYEQHIDLQNGITCSTHAKSKNHTMTAIYTFIAAIMSVSNLIVLSMFISKLYSLLKEMAADNYNVTAVRLDFVIIMKHQTMLVGIAVTSSVICWSLQSALQIGQIFANCDFIVSVFICFLTCKINQKYFKLFKCDVLSLVCCKWFEKLISAKTSTVTELKLAACVSQSSENGDDADITDFTGTSIAKSTASSSSSQIQTKSVSIDVA